MNHVRGFHGYMHPRARIHRRDPLINWRDPLEVSGAIAGAIGIAVCIGMWASIL